MARPTKQIGPFAPPTPLAYTQPRECELPGPCCFDFVYFLHQEARENRGAEAPFLGVAPAAERAGIKRRRAQSLSPCPASRAQRGRCGRGASPINWSAAESAQSNRPLFRHRDRAGEDRGFRGAADPRSFSRSVAQSWREIVPPAHCRERIGARLPVPAWFRAIAQPKANSKIVSCMRQKAAANRAADCGSMNAAPCQTLPRPVGACLPTV